MKQKYMRLAQEEPELKKVFEQLNTEVLEDIGADIVNYNIDKLNQLICISYQMIQQHQDDKRKEKKKIRKKIKDTDTQIKSIRKKLRALNPKEVREKVDQELYVESMRTIRELNTLKKKLIQELNSIQ